MADERYRRLLGIEPTGEIPSHYELLLVERSVTDAQVIEGAYKEQMKKLQQIRSSKDKGFIEFLKEELRTARLTLTNPDRRKAYDESLLVDAAQTFREWVKPMMALGVVPRGVHDTMVQKGVSDGLSPEGAAQVIRDIAAECGATLEGAGDDSHPGSAPAVQTEEDTAPVEEDHAELVHGDEAMPSAEEEVSYEEGGGEEPTFTDDLDPESAPVATEPPARTSPGPARRAAPAPAPEEQQSKVVRNRGFYEQGAPWSRGGRGGSAAEARPATPAGRPPAPAPAARAAAPAAGRQAESSGTQRQRWRTQNDQSAVSEAARLFNLGAKLAKVAGEVHHQLQFYFPPANGRTTITYQRGGVSYEKVFETEQKTYRDALQKFQSAMERLGDLAGAQADELRTQANQRITLIKGILDEIRQHKLRQLAGPSKADELRMWQSFVGSPRSARLGQSIGEG